MLHKRVQHLAPRVNVLHVHGLRLVYLLQCSAQPGNAFVKLLLQGAVVGVLALLLFERGEGGAHLEPHVLNVAAHRTAVVVPVGTL